MKTPKLFKKYFDGWPQLVCFDLDGTLVDSAPDLAAAIDRVLLEQDKEAAGEDRVRQWVGQGASLLVKRAMEWAEIGESAYEKCYQSFLLAYKESLTNKTVLYPHVLDLLKALKMNKVPMAVVTNKPSVFTKPILEHFELQDYFAWILSADSLAEKKPSPAPLLHCSEGIEAEESQCLMVGDSITDFHAAQAAGFKVALLTYGYHQDTKLDALGADMLLDDLIELLL